MHEAVRHSAEAYYLTSCARGKRLRAGRRRAKCTGRDYSRRGSRLGLIHLGHRGPRRRDLTRRCKQPVALVREAALPEAVARSRTAS